MERSTAERVAGLTPARVTGTFFRHAAPNRDAFAGGEGGRWGLAFPVIYLGRPVEAVTAEAYRHLVEASGVPADKVATRRLYTVTIDVGAVLDLTAAGAAAAVGLSHADLSSEVDDYTACQRVAQAAHQLEMHGVLAPSATGIGQTLAIFRKRVKAEELPLVQAEQMWNTLPPDPRVLRALPSTRATGADR